MPNVTVRINQAGIDEFKVGPIEEWLGGVLIDAHREAVSLVNVDTGNLRSSIGFGLERRGGDPVGYLFAGTNYAIFQEFEPGETIPGVGRRKRRGGKPFLRPGVMKALQKYTR